ncbi:isochorismatase family protein [Chloroflexota bacterium]
MKNIKLPRLPILIVLISLSIGIVLGILLQWQHIPGTILFKASSYFPESYSQVDVSNGVDSDRTITLMTRKFAAAGDWEEFVTEMDSSYIYNTFELDLRKTALILIDVWQYHPNDGWLERAGGNIRAKIVPLLDLARKHGLRVIHSPHSQKIANEAEPLPNELVVNSQSELISYLEAHHIEILTYAGYASNWCVLNRPDTGIIEMRRLSYEIILIRDCTIAFETPETLDGEWANKVTANMIEVNYGATTTLADLKEAFAASAD